MPWSVIASPPICPLMILDFHNQMSSLFLYGLFLPFLAIDTYHILIFVSISYVFELLPVSFYPNPLSHHIHILLTSMTVSSQMVGPSPVEPAMGSIEGSSRKFRINVSDAGMEMPGFFQALR